MCGKTLIWFLGHPELFGPRKFCKFGEFSKAPSWKNLYFTSIYMKFVASKLFTGCLVLQDITGDCNIPASLTQFFTHYGRHTSSVCVWISSNKCLFLLTELFCLVNKKTGVCSSTEGVFLDKHKYWRITLGTITDSYIILQSNYTML